MIPPQTQRVAASTIPLVRIDGILVKVIAGEAFGVSGPIQTTTEIQYLDVTLQPNSELELPIPATHNAMIYVFEGSVQSPTEITRGNLILLSQDGDRFLARSTSEGARFLAISGTPLNEPIARKGPFVMNTEKEVYEAFVDYGNGLIGK
jgi:redox-sensitive bicupin YhaK (pirin superfamily)